MDEATAELPGDPFDLQGDPSVELADHTEALLRAYRELNDRDCGSGS